MPPRSASLPLLAAAFAACLALSDLAAATPRQRPAGDAPDGSATSARARLRRPPPAREPLPAELREGFEAWLREGLAEGLASGFSRSSGGFVPRVGLDFTLLAMSSSSTAAFSTTNVQEAGVDEAATIQFDGEFLYVAPVAAPGRAFFAVSPIARPVIIGLPVVGTPVLAPLPVREIDPGPVVEPPPALSIRVLRASDAPAEAEEVAEIELPGVSSVSGMYLLAGRRGEVWLLVVGSAYGAARLATLRTPPWDWGTSRTTLQLFDVTDPTAAREQWSLVIEGQLVSTRRVEETLHLVTRATPSFRPVDVPLDPERARLRARNRVMRASAAGLLPRLWLDGGAPQPLVSPRRCMLPLRDAATQGTPSLLTVTSLDLRNPARRASLCMAELAGTLYSSTRSLYLTASSWSWGKTVVHKFAYTQSGPQYRGVGTVEGTLFGTQRGFSLGEHEGVLGVVTDLYAAAPEPAAPELGRYRLTLLRESPGRDLVLEEVSHLPSEAAPEPIGKPGDFLHGVRFLGERLYVVTYRNLDPLYVIDLSDPAAPRIAGQLEVPGFSDYLHPIGSDLLLGVGFDTAPDVRNDWFQGIKVELFDVSDPAAVESLDAIAVGRRGSQSAALRDHHAISHLPAGSEGVHRFAVPIEVHDREPRPQDGPSTSFPWLHTGLYLFEVEGAGSGAAARLRDVGAVVASDASAGGSGQHTHGDRSVIQGAAVHYLHQGQVWSAPWDAPDDVVGPR